MNQCGGQCAHLLANSVQNTLRSCAEGLHRSGVGGEHLEQTPVFGDADGLKLLSQCDVLRVVCAEPVSSGQNESRLHIHALFAAAE